jgi:hypothetical protein
MDLTTLPPLHIFGQETERIGVSSGRFMVGCRKSVNTQAHKTRKILVRLPNFRAQHHRALAMTPPNLLSEADGIASGRV